MLKNHSFLIIFLLLGQSTEYLWRTLPGGIPKDYILDRAPKLWRWKDAFPNTKIENEGNVHKLANGDYATDAFMKNFPLKDLPATFTIHSIQLMDKTIWVWGDDYIEG